MKILKKKQLNRISTLFRNVKFTLINFVFANVFAEKIVLKLNVLYIIQYSKNTIFDKVNISNY